MSTAATETFKIIRNGFFKGVGLAAGFVTTSLFAAAAAINVFAPGDVISATKINRNFAIAAPEGAIMAFNLTSCPDGWAPADGTNGTPDLRGRFVRGLDSGTGRDPDEATRGGLASSQEDAFQGHWHQHEKADGNNTFVYGGTFFSVVGASAYGGPTRILDPVADASGITPRTAHETRPKNVALMYCMRQN